MGLCGARGGDKKGPGDKRGRQKGTGQISEKMKEDENGIGFADARSLSSEAGKGGGVANK